MRLGLCCVVLLASQCHVAKVKFLPVRLERNDWWLLLYGFDYVVSMKAVRHDMVFMSTKIVDPAVVFVCFHTELLQ